MTTLPAMKRGCIPVAPISDMYLRRFEVRKRLRGSDRRAKDVDEGQQTYGIVRLAGMLL